MTVLRKAALGLAAASLAFCAAGCTSGTAGAGPPAAFLYSNYTVPMFFRAPESGAVEFSEDLKTGYSSAANFVAPMTYNAVSFGWGDMSLDEAMLQGGIDEFVFADCRKLSVLRVFNSVEVHAYGK